MKPKSMVLDSSAVVAIFLREAEAEALLRAMEQADSLAISTATILETTIVLSRRFGKPMQHALQWFLHELQVEEVPFDTQQNRLAQQAWWSFGKSRSPANLNFGDCISYALARHRGQPLLCKGNDFGQTDLPLAAWS